MVTWWKSSSYEKSVIEQLQVNDIKNEDTNGMKHLHCTYKYFGMAPHIKGGNCR